MYTRKVLICFFTSVLLMFTIYLHQYRKCSDQNQCKKEEAAVRFQGDSYLIEVGECNWKMRTIAFMLRGYALTHNNLLPMSKSHMVDNQTSWLAVLPDIQPYHLRCDRDQSGEYSSYRFNTALYGKSLSELEHRKGEVLIYESQNNHLRGPEEIYVSSLFKKDPNDRYFEPD